MTIIKAFIYAVSIPCIIIFLGKLIDFIGNTILRRLFPRIWFFISVHILRPGVIFHELCHALLAFITGAKIISMHIFQVKNLGNGNYQLGCVEYMPRGNVIQQNIQIFFSAIAPTVLGILAIIWLCKYGINILPGFVVIYLLCCLAVHIDLSNPDIKCVLLGSIIIVPILTIIIYFTKFDLINFLGGFIENGKQYLRNII